MKRLRVVSDNAKADGFRDDPTDIGSPQTRLAASMRQTASDVYALSCAHRDLATLRERLLEIEAYVFDALKTERHGFEVQRLRREFVAQEFTFEHLCSEIADSRKEQWSDDPARYGALCFVFGERLAAASFFALPNLA